MLDPHLLRTTWARVTQYGEQVPLYFYSHLFLSHPEVRPMFPPSMAAQRDRLVAALGAVVANVDDLGSAVPYLQGLGRDHRKFAVEPGHYPAVGASLLATLEHFLGADWTPPVAESWTEAYGIVSQVMVDAAAEAQHTSPPWWDAEIVAHEVLGGRRDIARLTIATRHPYPYAAGQSFTLESAMAPARWRFYTPAHPPRTDGLIELHVKLIGTVSWQLVNVMGVGDRLRLGPPVGHQLTLASTTPGSDLLLIAGSTGVAPLRAVIEELALVPDHGRRVTLYYGARIASDLYDLPRLRQLAERNTSWLSIHPVVSDDYAWEGERGLVGDVAAARGGWPGHEVFIVGSAGMCEHTVARLKEAGVVPGAIHLEESQP
ncbi:FAD-binding oxidoreductase [Catenulispora yoronensis]|uniref:nitric oxide dioxygenase n=1 Tax=Catenulispora yoronensis TaxID=450799 RepID=A0ABP5G3Z8_9ACTN